MQFLQANDTEIHFLAIIAVHLRHDKFKTVNTFIQILIFFNLCDTS